jgi:predicted aminopeptidase
MAEFDPMKFFALWMFTHDQADDLMVQSVARGKAGAGEGMSGGADAFTDGFMAMVAEEKERLKAQIASGGADSAADDASQERFDEVRFEVAELRGRIDQMQRTLDAIAAHVAPKGA